MKNKYLVAGIFAVFAIGLIAATGSFTGIGLSSSKAVTSTGTYSQGGADTITWAREKGVVGLSLGIIVSDSSNIQNIVVQRLVGGRKVGNAVAVADTIAGAAVAGVVPVSADSSADAASFVHAVTMTPYAESYRFIVKYATGVTYKNAVDTNTVQYRLIKQYSAE